LTPVRFAAATVPPLALFLTARLTSPHVKSGHDHSSVGETGLSSLMRLTTCRTRARSLIVTDAGLK
jgi:hypothetical protein